MYMNINVTGENITLTPDIYAYLDKKNAHIEKILGADAPGASGQIEIGKASQHHKTGVLFEARITLRAGGRDFTAAAEGESLYGAIDAVKDELCRELTSHKDKQLTLVKRGGRTVKTMLRRLWPFGQSGDRP